MHIVYFGSMCIGRPNGPGLNERDFIEDFDANTNASLYIYAPVESGVNLSLRESTRVCRVVSVPVIREFHAAAALMRDLITGEIEVDVVVFRLGQLPVIQAILIYFFSRRSVPSLIKTVGVGTCRLAKKTGLLNRLNFRLFRIIFAQVRYLDTPTNFARREIIETFQLPDEKVILIGNGAKEVALEPRPRKDSAGLRLGYVGRFPYVRGGRQVVECVSKARELGLDARGLITGSDEEVCELRALACALNIEKCIEFPGVLPQDDVAALFKNIDVGFSVVEGIEGTAGQKLRQYLMHGCCVVFKNDEYMENRPEKFIIPYSSPEEIVLKLWDGAWQTEAMDRNLIHEWAKHNVSYNKFNSQRIKLIQGLAEDKGKK